jgi:hypothetical protein
MPNTRTQAALYGGSKTKSRNSIRRSAYQGKGAMRLRESGQGEIGSAGFGGHFRAVQGFRYYGEAGLAAKASA